MTIDAERLVAACGELSGEAGIKIQTLLEPLGGPGTTIKPAIYPGPAFQEDWRWWGEPAAKTKAIVIDNTPSQANRLEAALELLREPLGLPELVLDLSQVAGLPPHLPRRISGFRFPHRQADAYLRDSVIGETRFQSTAVGQALFSATSDDPGALFAWFPQALLFGYWQSHLGKKRSQAKLPRSWVSEIVGYEPASPDAERTRQRGVKGDPLNLSVDEPVTFNPDDLLAPWTVVEDAQKTGRGKQREALSEIGHGQVPFRDSEGALTGVSFRAIQQTATVSFAGLRRVHCRDAEASACGRALLVAMGLAAHVTAFGRSFSLRSGCELRPVRSEWTWLGASGDEAMPPMSADDAVAVLHDCIERAEAVGLTADGGWRREPLVLSPSKGLASAISKTWPLTD